MLVSFRVNMGNRGGSTNLSHCSTSNLQVIVPKDTLFRNTNSLSTSYQNGEFFSGKDTTQRNLKRMHANYIRRFQNNFCIEKKKFFVDESQAKTICLYMFDIK